jgi:hypothetical protein
MGESKLIIRDLLLGGAFTLISGEKKLQILWIIICPTGLDGSAELTNFWQRLIVLLPQSKLYELSRWMMTLSWN